MDEMSALRLKCSETDGSVIKATLMSWTAGSMNQVEASMLSLMMEVIRIAKSGLAFSNSGQW